MDLLHFIPSEAHRIVEIGCSTGALARQLKEVDPRRHITGIDIDPDNIPKAKAHCDEAACANIEQQDFSFFEANRLADTWVFGDTLEHLADPWRILRLIRKVLPVGGRVVACNPNAQHWSLQVRLATGLFRYENAGLLDRTHLRWFTRQTMLELFQQTGFEVEAIAPRIFNEPQREVFVGIIGDLAENAGIDPEVAMNDALPLQYLIRAIKRTE